MAVNQALRCLPGKPRAYRAYKATGAILAQLNHALSFLIIYPGYLLMETLTRIEEVEYRATHFLRKSQFPCFIG